MKKFFILILLLSCLLQSCFSYREMDKNSNSIKIGEKYKIQVDSKNYEGSLIFFNDSVFKIKNFQIQNEFKISEIKKIKKRKLSLLKIIGIPVLIVAVFIATYDPKASIGTPNF